MRTIKSSHIFAAFLAAFAVLQPALAQQPGADAPPPPKLEPLEEGEPPAITIRKPEERAVIEEQKAPGGRVTEIKVTSGRSTYYLLPLDPTDATIPADGQAGIFRAAQWNVLNFDLGPTPAEVQEAQAQAAEGAPLPPQPTGK